MTILTKRLISDIVDAKEIILLNLKRIDEEFSIYQTLYRKYHRCEDEVAKLIHRHLVELCKQLIKQITEE
jgi:hypothetical protein